MKTLDSLIQVALKEGAKTIVFGEGYFAAWLVPLSELELEEVKRYYVQRYVQFSSIVLREQSS